jgi:hypothetical protein
MRRSERIEQIVTELQSDALAEGDVALVAGVLADQEGDLGVPWDPEFIPPERVEFTAATFCTKAALVANGNRVILSQLPQHGGDEILQESVRLYNREAELQSFCSALAEAGGCWQNRLADILKVGL